MKTNFMASWDEIGDSCEMEDIYALSTMKDLDGKDKLFYMFEQFLNNCSVRYKIVWVKFLVMKNFVQYWVLK